MLENIRQTLAGSVKDMVRRAMEPSDLIAELTTELERHTVTLRTETAKAIFSRNMLKARVDEGHGELAAELTEAEHLADTMAKLLTALEDKLREARIQGEQIAAGISAGTSQDVIADISRQYKELDEYLKSL